MFTWRYSLFLSLFFLAGCVKQQQPTVSNSERNIKKFTPLAEKYILSTRLLIVKYSPEIIELHKELFVPYFNAQSLREQKNLDESADFDTCFENLKDQVNSLFIKPFYLLGTSEYFNEAEAKKILNNVENNRMLSILFAFIDSHSLSTILLDEKKEYVIGKIIQKKYADYKYEYSTYDLGMRCVLSDLKKYKSFFTLHNYLPLKDEGLRLVNNIEAFLKSLQKEVSALPICKRQNEAVAEELARNIKSLF